MRLTDDISLVGGGNTGFNLSAPLDCHIYLINGGNGELALVDAGMGGKYGETDRIIENIQRDGYELDRVTLLILPTITPITPAAHGIGERGCRTCG